MDAKIVTLLYVLTAVACFAGGAFVPVPAAQAALFSAGGFLFGAVGVMRPTDQVHVNRSKAMQKIRGEKKL